MGIPRDARLRRAIDFSAVYDGRRSVRNRTLQACFRIAAGRSPRLGLSVSRRIGDAVRRNRCKRLLREIFRLERHAVPAVDLILIPRPGDSAFDFATLRESFLHLMRKIRRELEDEAELAGGSSR